MPWVAGLGYFFNKFTPNSSKVSWKTCFFERNVLYFISLVCTSFPWVIICRNQSSFLSSASSVPFLLGKQKRNNQTEHAKNYLNNFFSSTGSWQIASIIGQLSYCNAEWLRPLIECKSSSHYTIILF